jgi:hypothetical protein
MQTIDARLDSSAPSAEREETAELAPPSQVQA